MPSLTCCVSPSCASMVGSRWAIIRSICGTGAQLRMLITSAQVTWAPNTHTGCYRQRNNCLHARDTHGKTGTASAALLVRVSMPLKHVHAGAPLAPHLQLARVNHTLLHFSESLWAQALHRQPKTSIQPCPIAHNTYTCRPTRSICSGVLHRFAHMNYTCRQCSCTCSRIHPKHTQVSRPLSTVLLLQPQQFP
jgi:hypothetical protein